MACRRALRAHSPCRQPFAVQLLRLIKGCGCAVRNFHSNKTAYNKCQFGFLFDIDGVIVRGRKPLPHAKEAFQLLAKDGQFKVPTLFVTNAGNSLRSRKAQQLSEWLGIQVTEDQVVMSHSPLKMFRQFHDKHVLVNGQGPVKAIAQNIGFTNVTTVEELSHRFPDLDKMDHQRKKAAPCAFEEFFPKIEAVILFGEPVRWETPMQLIMDVLLTDGQPSNDLPDIPYPHLPVLACNMDLLWMAENRLPRLGHGCFMNALEGLYQKITGKEMKYTALIGKPSEITYHHADYLLTQQAKLLGVQHIRRIYCVGDNPTTDIYGGNLYNRYLQRRRKDSNTPSQTASKKRRVASHRADDEFLDEDNDDEDDMDTSIYQRDSGANMRVIKSLEEDKSGVEKALSCETILVCTGVFKKGTETTALLSPRLICNHNHRDFVIDPMLINPTHVVPDVLEAVKLVFEKETYP
ncbi:cat eye syndrome critical region protein 5 [Biomphalaria pfeifferi]|uniref:Haloacid dehalogenase-like hydrolase domain-containing 5 n=1 Tax=Biomphalaria pfeifferi TaxID=112525 RepID=A0AAD8B1P0_BIOPF|nr:cat eye syndrome critical region protein 5 [Biomphalaria pfeifferi]